MARASAQALAVKRALHLEKNLRKRTQGKAHSLLDFGASLLAKWEK